MRKLKIIIGILVILIIINTVWTFVVYKPSALYKVGVIECGKDFADKWRTHTLGSEKSDGYDIVDKEEIDEYFDYLEQRYDIKIGKDVREEIIAKVEAMNMPTVIVSPMNSRMLWTHRREPNSTVIVLIPPTEWHELKPSALYVYTTECTTFDTPDNERLWCVH